MEALRKQADLHELSRTARVRLDCLLHYATHGRDASQTCRRFGISRSTFYNWLKKADLEDPSSFEDRSKAPKHVPQPEADEQTIALIRAYRESRAQLNREKISELLQAEHGILLSPSTVGRIINRHGFYFGDSLLHKEKRAAHLSSDAVAQTRSVTAKHLRSTLATAVVLSVAGMAAVRADTAAAMEGSVYQLHTTFPSQTAAQQLEGAAFTVEDGAITDTKQPLSGSVYQITDGAGLSSSASSVASSASSDAAPSSAAQTPVTGSVTGDVPVGGGRRSSAQSSAYSSQSVEAVASSGASSSDEPEDMSSSSVSSATPEIPLEGWQSRMPDGAPVSLQGDFYCPVLQSVEVSHSAALPLPASVASVELLWFILILLTAGAMAGVHLWLWVIGRKRKTIRRTTVLRGMVRLLQRTMIALLMGAALLALFLLHTVSADAATTGPLNHRYQGHLLTSAGVPVTTPVTIRLSYWKSADFTPADLGGDGSLNVGAAEYVQWQEEHTITPTSDGSFAVEIGSLQPLPDFRTLPASTLGSLFLQVDVKAAGDPDSTYDLLDANPADTTVDRTSVLSLPFARNADLLDQRDVGTGSGSIPVLSSGASLYLNGDLLINSDNEGRDAVLTFGNDLLRETIRFSSANSRFEFSDDVQIAGNLGVTGALSGALLHAEQSLTTSGSLVFEGAASGSSLYLGTSLKGAGLTACTDPAASKLLYDAATGRFSCGADQTGASEIGTAAFSGSVRAVGDPDYLKKTGGTMTGTLTIDVKNGTPATIGLNVINTVSGAVIHAEKELTTSGTLSVEGAGVFEGSLTFGDAISDAITVHAGTWTFMNDTNIVLNGGVNGLSFDTDTLSVDALNNRIGILTTAPETELEVAGTISGSLIRAGNMTLSGAVVYSSGNTLKQTAKGASGQLLISQGTSAPEWKNPTGSMVWFLNGTQVTGASQGARIRMPFDMTVTAVTMDTTGAPTGAALIADIKKNDATIFSTKPQINDGAVTGGTNAVFSDTFLPAGTLITIDIAQVGSTYAGSGLTINLTGIRKY